MTTVAAGIGKFVMTVVQAARTSFKLCLETIIPFLIFVSTVFTLITSTGVGNIIANALSGLATSPIGLIVMGLIITFPLLSPIIGPGAVIPQVIRYLTAHFREPLTLEALARALGVSRFHLSHVFSEKIGQGFSAYLASIRIDCACALLAGTNRSVTEIAAESGFESQRSFFRAFGARCCMTPLAYRRRAQGTQAQK